MQEYHKKVLTEVPLIMHGRAFSDYGDFVSKKKYDKIKEQLNKKSYPVSTTVTSYRTINSWSEAGLLLGENERDNGWRKFSFLDLLWLEVIKELRAVGFGLEKIAVLKDCLFKGLYTKHKEDTAFFAFYVTHTQSYDVYLVVTATGKGDLAFSQEYQSSNIIGTIPKTHTIVNINKLLAKLVQSPKEGTLKRVLVPLDEKEL